MTLPRSSAMPDPTAPFAALVEEADVWAHGRRHLHGTRTMRRTRGCDCEFCLAWERGYNAGRGDRSALQLEVRT